MHPFMTHPMYHRTMKLILRREVRRGNMEAQKILDNEDVRAFFDESLPDAAEMAPDPIPVPPTPLPPIPNPDHPFLAWLAGLVQWAVANPDKIAAFIAMILKLFGL